MQFTAISLSNIPLRHLVLVEYSPSYVSIEFQACKTINVFVSYLYYASISKTGEGKLNRLCFSIYSLQILWADFHNVFKYTSSSLSYDLHIPSRLISYLLQLSIYIQ